MSSVACCRRAFLVWLAALLMVDLYGLVAAHADDAAPSPRYFKITVVDEQTGRGVPLVELRTVSNVRYVTDSNGIVAFYEPGLMDDQEVFFFVQSHGYQFPKDGFGMAGTRLRVKSGGSAQIKIKRVNIAERLYRVTGEGVYRDSVLLGERVPTRRPVLNGKVTGQDSVMTIRHRNKIYWFWGDTNRPAYPLGNFAMSGATSELPGSGGLDPGVGVDLAYFLDKEGFSRPMVPLPEPGLVWIDGLMTLTDETGRERIVAQYERLKGLGETLARGLVIYNDAAEAFEPLSLLDLKNPRYPRGHPFRLSVDGGAPYYYFPSPYPNLRVRAELAAVRDPARYEAYTPLIPGSRYDGAAVSKLDRDEQGRLRWAWKRDTDPISPAQQRDLIAAGKMKANESPFHLWDIDTDKAVDAHGGSVCWNAFRKKWVMIFVQSGGASSYLGEVWYAEADAPEGPWRQAKKIVTHDKYSFYNPTQHPLFDQAGGRIIYFEGTYTNTFSGNPEFTPRYDYNQIMYRLDLSDARLRPRATP